MKKPLLFLAAFFACVIAYFSLRSLIGAAAAAVVAGLSASAIAAGTAGSAKAAGGGAAAAHIPAAVGALAGALLLAVNLRGRPWLERAVLALASYLAAYYGALAAHHGGGRAGPRWRAQRARQGDAARDPADVRAPRGAPPEVRGRQAEDAGRSVRGVR